VQVQIEGKFMLWRYDLGLKNESFIKESVWVVVGIRMKNLHTMKLIFY